MPVVGWHSTGRHALFFCLFLLALTLAVHLPRQAVLGSVHAWGSTHERFLGWWRGCSCSVRVSGLGFSVPPSDAWQAPTLCGLSSKTHMVYVTSALSSPAVQVQMHSSTHGRHQGQQQPASQSLLLPHSKRPPAPGAAHRRERRQQRCRGAQPLQRGHSCCYAGCQLPFR